MTVAPDAQDSGAGTSLMRDVMARASVRKAPGIRLVQATYHTRSLSQYAKLGFQVRDLLACMNGPTPGGAVPGYRTRPAVSADIEACGLVCRHVHGHDRNGEVVEAVARGSARRSAGWQLMGPQECQSQSPRQRRESFADICTD